MNRNVRLHLTWDILIIFWVTMLAIFLPLQMVFDLVPQGWTVGIHIIVAGIFILDILFSITKIRKGWTRPDFGEPTTLTAYFKKWFVFDALAAIPFNVFPGLSAYALLRLTKLVRVGHILYIWRHLLFKLKNTLSLVSLIYSLVLSLHWLSCGWLAVRGINQDLGIYENYIDALYWCLTTISTVGYGDILPHNYNEKLYAIFTMALGLVYTGYIIGYIASILSKRDPATAMYQENLDRLSQAVKYRGLPQNLQERIYGYYTYIWRKQTGYFEADFLDSLPPGLKREVSTYLKKDVIEKVPLFSDLRESFLDEVSLLLRSRIIAPGERVVKAGDDGSEMYFIVRGTCDVFSPEGEHVAQLSEGDFFGEISLFLGQKRTAEIRAVDYCDVYTLSKSSLDFVTRKYPEVQRRLERKIEARIAQDKARMEQG